MATQDPRVPVEVEDYLIGLFARAGQVGGSIGGAIGGGVSSGIGGGGAGAFGGGRGGARGGARAATRMKTQVEERSGDAPGTAQDVVARLTAAFPKAVPLAAADRLRLAVPLGVTGLQQIVLDLQVRPGEASSAHVLLRGYGKEGLLSRHPTLRVTNEAWSAIQSESR